MNHLKHINEGFNTDDYYQEINDVEWDRFDPIMMTKSTIEKIQKIIPSVKLHQGTRDCEFIRYGKLLKFNRFSFEKKTEIKQWYSMTGKKYEIIGLSIFETEDEYFYVSYSKRIDKDNVAIIETYKCDQLDGLKKLLKDKEII
jgi:hypothetical protein